MKPHAAIHQLMRHAGLAPEAANKGTAGTAVGMLRPFGGIDSSVMDSALHAARVLLAAKLDQKSRLEAILAILELVSVTRAWGLDDDSMLRRNKRLNDDQYVALIKWVRELEELAKRLVEAGLRE